jgi:hypothetical protein
MNVRGSGQWSNSVRSLIWPQPIQLGNSWNKLNVLGLLCSIGINVSGKVGRTEDNARSGRPENDARLIKDIADVLSTDPPKSLDELLTLSESVKSWLRTVHKIVTQDLNMNMVCARWVPRLLTDEMKATRVAASRQCYPLYQGERTLSEAHHHYGWNFSTFLRSEE